MKALLVLIVVLLVVIIVLSVLHRMLEDQYETCMQKLKIAENNVEKLQMQVLTLRKAWEAVDGNEQAAEEEINELHGGDALGNAIIGLHDD